MHSHDKRFHKKPVEIQRYDRQEFLDLLNSKFPKSLSLKRVLDLLIGLAGEKWKSKQREAALRELNGRIQYYTFNLQFASDFEPDWAPVFSDERDREVITMDGKLEPIKLGAWDADANVVSYFQGFIWSRDFQKLACCERSGCNRFFIKIKAEQRFCHARCRDKAFKTSHRKEHADYMRQWRKDSKHCK